MRTEERSPEKGAQRPLSRFKTRLKARDNSPVSAGQLDDGVLIERVDSPMESVRAISQSFFACESKMDIQRSYADADKAVLVAVRRSWGERLDMDCEFSASADAGVEINLKVVGTNVQRSQEVLEKFVQNLASRLEVTLQAAGVAISTTSTVFKRF